ncbi:hypothetical protein ACA910_014878 [Epithemia clementina (nom. ined.)]
MSSPLCDPKQTKPYPTTPSTPLSESKSVQIDDNNIKEFAKIAEASKCASYLSPIGKEIILKSLTLEDPINLEQVNDEVLHAEEGLDNHNEPENEIRKKRKFSNSSDNPDNNELKKRLTSNRTI